MKFQVNIISKEVKAAAMVAENLFHPCSEMMDELRVKDDFKYNSGTGSEIVSKILGFNKTIQVFSYRPRNPFTKAVGYFDGKAIHINVNKISSLTHSDLVGMLCHEYLHFVGFNHGTGWRRNYKTQDKVLYSLPYFVSENIGRWL